TVDGLVGNDLGSPQIFSGTINFDAIAAVKVQLNNYQAENGRNGSAMVSLVTKSGTKSYKGSAYAYARNEKLNANDCFNNPRGNYNHQFQERLNGRRHQQLGGVDLRPTARDGFYARASTWYADNQGFAVPGGAANWGLLGQHYTFTDLSLIGDYTRIVSSAL